jgi:hypothetical protein
MGGMGMGGQFGGFINESTATMGVQMAEKYVDQQFARYVNVSALKNLFNGECFWGGMCVKRECANVRTVSNSYVIVCTRSLDYGGSQHGS